MLEAVRASLADAPDSVLALKPEAVGVRVEPHVVLMERALGGDARVHVLIERADGSGASMVLSSSMEAGRSERSLMAIGLLGQQATGQMLHTSIGRTLAYAAGLAEEVPE